MDRFIIVLHLVSVVISLGFIVYVEYQKKTALSSHLLMFSLGVLINNLSYLFELKSGTIEEALMAIRFEYLGLSTATIAAFLFICELFHARIPHLIRGTMVLAFFFTTTMNVTNEYHHLFYTSASIAERDGIAVFYMEKGPIYGVHTVITLASMGACIGVIIYAFMRDAKWKQNYRKYLFLGMAALVPLIFWLLRLVGSLKEYDLIPFGLFCANTFFILIIFFFRIFDVAEIAKNDVLENLEEGVLVCDEDGNVLYTNKRVKDIFADTELTRFSDVLCRMVPAEEGKFQIDDRYYAVLESEVYEEGRATGKTWCFIDMSQTMERERQLRELNEIAISANNAKSNFLAHMSHEIRTPINTILGMNELIAREAQNLNVLEYSNNIKSEGKTLLSLINDLLDFSKIESGKMELTEVEYETASLLHELELNFSAKAEEKDLEFVMDPEEDLPAVLYGDVRRMKQIIGNLLSNAIKYTARGSVCLTIRWTPVEEKKAEFTISVRDTGIGMREEDIEGIFEKFSRFDSKRNNDVEGVGLGMNITSQLLEMMNGKIEIKSEYGTGSEFIVKLPQVIVDATPIGDYKTVSKKENREGRRITFTAPLAKILVVDDNVMNRVVVKGLLKRTLVQVDEAESGMECLEKTKDTAYDVILMDHMMPKMDGVETLERFKEQNGASRMAPVIVLTANAVSGVRDYYIEQGFDDYMSKPINGVELEDVLLRFLPEELVLKSEVNKRRYKVEREQKEEFCPEEIRRVLSVERINFSIGLEKLQGNIERYRGEARQFVINCEERLSCLHEYIRTENVPAYTALIQNVKEDALLLGALELVEMAKEQEKMGEEGNLAFIRDHFTLLSKEYLRVAGCFERLYDCT